MKKLFKHGNKSVLDTKLVKDAIRANKNSAEDFEELIEVESDGKLKEWMKGFGTGMATTVIGLAAGVAIGLVIVNKSGNDA
jgi:hypothetical protein